MRPITVVLADDHMIVREGLGHLLEAQEDITVVGYAANGHEAVQLISGSKPDIVIMDIAMPAFNGITATQEITREFPKTRVIILSMHSAGEYIIQALQAGALGYLLKESAGIEVVEAIRTVHRGERYLSKKVSNQIIDDYIHRLHTTDLLSPLNSLSLREKEVFQLVVEGKSSSEIAKILAISTKTVDTYRSRLMSKLGIRDIPSLVKFAIQHGLTSLD